MLTFNRYASLELLSGYRKTVDAAGTPKSWNDYYPFGLLMEGRNGVNGDAEARFKFTGKERDAETGNDYFGARYYDPRIGRWLSIDPEIRVFTSNSVIKSGLLGLSPYQYVRNDPLNRIDLDGFTDWKLVGKGALQFGGGLITAVGGSVIAVASDGTMVPLVGTTMIVGGLGIAGKGLANLVAGFSDKPEQLPQGITKASLMSMGASSSTADAINLSLATGQLRNSSIVS